MLTKLMQVNSLQEDIIKRQANAIDELYILLCELTDVAGADGLDPLYNQLQDIADKRREL